MRRRALVPAALLTEMPAPAPAQQADVMNSGRRTMTAERMRDDERIELDGVLDEPVWDRAQHGGEFIMQDPVLGGTPTERTEVRIVFNRDHLYIGATLYDSEPDKLKGNTRKRDEFLSADDRFMWTMDTFLNQQTGYFFEMNPSGLMADALKGPSGTNNREWDGIWNARAHRSDIGWVTGDRPAVPHPGLRSERAGLGHQLPADGPPQERGAPVDRPRAQPGPAAHGQRRAAARAEGRDPGAGPRTEALPRRPHQRRARAGAGDRRRTPRRMSAST